MLPSPRLLVSGALAAGFLTLPVLLADPAAADITLPSPLPTVSAPVAVPTLPEPLASTVTTLTGGATQTPTSGDDISSPATGSGLPTALPTAVPALPSLPSVPGGSSGGTGGRESHAPAKRSTSSTGTASSSSPLGDDVLPAAVEDQLCAVLEQVMTPMPEEISGLPASVIAQLPAQVTDQVPDDVLRVVTLRCGSVPPAADKPASNASQADRKPTLSRQHRATHDDRTAPASNSYAALPHTGLVAGIPVSGLGLVLAGLALRRKARPATDRG
jgi:hypothetical protein